MKRRLEVVVGGRVQGVYFRASASEQARLLGLDGWVRNVPGGEVEAVFEGEEKALAAMELWCRTGPPGARVDRLDVSWGEATGAFGGFTVRR